MLRSSCQSVSGTHLSAAAGIIKPMTACLCVPAAAAHELGHWQAARKHGVSTYLPFIIPAGFGFIASFGGITRLKDFLPNRAALLEFAAQVGKGCARHTVAHA
jgi:hypothetical protein